MNFPQNQVRVTSVTSNSKESTLYLDSHADTYVLGANALVIQDHGRPVNVLSYYPALGDRTYQTVSSVIGYNHPLKGKTYHLIIYQATSTTHLEHHLLCTMQARVNDVTINEIPKFLASKPKNETHSIIVTDSDDPSQRLIFSLDIRGVTAYFPTRPITKGELESSLYLSLELTNEFMEWNPSNTTYEDQENAMTDFRGNVIHEW